MLKVLVGLPGCGKSTYSESLEGYTVLSSDMIREEIWGSADVQGNPKEVFDLLYKRMEKLFEQGENVVLDATNIKKRDRSVALKLAEKYNQPVEAIVFTVPFDICWERNNSRERKVPMEAYTRMVRQFEMPTEEEGFDKITTISE